jgi:hypothetical protein
MCIDEKSRQGSATATLEVFTSSKQIGSMFRVWSSGELTI